MPTIAPERQIHANLQIGRPDGITWEDVTDYLSSASVELGDISGIGTGQSGVDGVVRRMTFTLRNDRVLSILIWPVDGFVSGDRVLSGDGTVDGAATDGSWLARLLNQEPDYYGDSFAPRDRLSAWNTFNGQYAPLLWPNREVVLQVAVTDPGVEPQASDWVTLFHGYLGDSIRTSGPTVTCDARDLAKRLQDAYILTVREYGSEAGTPAEDVIQQIIDDNLGADEVRLFFPSGTDIDPRPVSESPGFMVTPYQVEYMSVWDAIQQVVAQFGWFLGYRWHPNTGRMQLILMEPPRNKDASTADFQFSWEDDIYTQDLEITDRDIRNVVTVTYRNAATGDRESVTVQDADSIATYGPRAMQIEEGDASLIDTPEEAQRLANAALADLKDMTATTQLNLPLLPTLDVFSGIVVTDPRVSSTDDFYGVENVRHVLDFEARQFRTEVVASGRVIGGHHRWLRMQTRPGAKSPIRRGDVTLPGIIAAPANLRIASSGTEQVGQTITSYAVLAWDAPANYRAERYRLQVRRKGELDWSNAQEYDVSEPRQKLVAPGGLTYEARVRVTPFEAANPDWSTTMEFTMPGDTQAPATPSGLTVVSHLRGVQASITPNTEADLSRYVWEKNVNGGGWTVFACDLVTDRVIPANAGDTVDVRVSAEDTSGNVSAPTTVVSAVAGRVGTDDSEDGFVTTVKLAPGSVTAVDVFQTSQETFFSTDNDQDFQSTGIGLVVEVEDPGDGRSQLVQISLTASTSATAFINADTQMAIGMLTQIRRNAVQMPAGVRQTSWSLQKQSGGGDFIVANLTSDIAYTYSELLPPGTYTYDIRIIKLGPSNFTSATMSIGRVVLSATVFKG